MPKLLSSTSIPFVYEDMENHELYIESYRNSILPQQPQEIEYADVEQINLFQQQKQQNNKQKEFYEQKLQTLMQNFKNKMGNQNEKWDVTVKKNDITGYVQENEENKQLCVSKGEGVIQMATTEDILQILISKDKSKVLNPGEKINNILLNIDDQFKLKFVRSSPPLVDDRYTLFLQKVEQYQNITYVYECSVDYEDLDKSLIKNCVQCFIKQIWIFEEIKEKDSVKIQFLSCIDPGGYIPNYIKRKTMQKWGYEKINDMRKYIKKNKVVKSLKSF